jgi:polyphosphate kinase
MSAFELVRTQEELYRKEYKGKELTEDEWVKILAENPRLMKRPIVINGKQAILAQPPELIERIR